MTDTPWHLTAPSFAEIEDAARGIAGVCRITPLLESPPLNARLGGRLLLKAEGLQRTGSFKMRGAYNRLRQLTDDERKRGVVAYSSGNHAQAVAAAAQLVGTRAVIVMPADAPRVKIENTRTHGAEIVLYDRHTEDRVAIFRRLAEERGLTMVPPYEDRRIVAGQGTLGREIVQQAAAMGAHLDALLVCCSGGGLTAGCAIALEALSPATQIFTVEPAGFDDTARSLASGSRVANDPAARSICDSALVDTPGEFTFSINHRLVTRGLVVTDADAVAAMAVAFREGLVVEPGGAIALAAVLNGAYPLKGRTAAVTLSGSNVDLGTALDLFRKYPLT